MAIHCQLLFATILYILVFCNHVVVLSTIIRGKILMDGHCYLFKTKMDDTNPSIFCQVLVSTSGCVSLYAAIMAIYHGYGTYTASKDSHIGRTMWVMPWLLLNSALVILTFICSCIYSVGLYLTCHEVEKHTTKFSSCIYQDKVFQPMLIAEITTWISVLFWISLVVIEAVRLRRNRRAKAREVYVEPTTSDVVNIGDIIPTA